MATSKLAGKESRFRVLVILACLAGVFAIWKAVDIYGRPAPKPPTLSRATTFFTEPVRSNGSLDYAAAINKQLGADVDPENNACVFLQKAFGPSEYATAAFYAELQMQTPSEDGVYLQPLDAKFLKDQGATSERIEEVFDLYGSLLARPWTRDECPELAEWLTGNSDEARRLIHRASEETRHSIRLQGEADDWSDGFFPIEGRLADSRGPLDVLGEWITGFAAYLDALNGDERAVARLDGLLEQDGRRIPRPFSYQYALWASLVLPEAEREIQTRYMSRAFNDLQTRAGRFDDNQTKHAWLTDNPWNKAVMNEAQRRKFL